MAQAGNGSTSEEAVVATQLERVTVNLTTRSSRLLRELMGSLGLSKTDTINRAVQLYADLQKVMDADGAIYVREAGGELERLRIY